MYLLLTGSTASGFSFTQVRRKEFRNCLKHIQPLILAQQIFPKRHYQLYCSFNISRLYTSGWVKLQPSKKHGVLKLHSLSYPPWHVHQRIKVRDVLCQCTPNKLCHYLSSGLTFIFLPLGKISWCHLHLSIFTSSKHVVTVLVLSYYQ